MSWNATVDRLRARAQHDALKDDEYTRRLLYEAVGEIERFARRVPNPDDLRMVLMHVMSGPNHPVWDAVARVRATLEETE